jgi:fucose permease
LSPRLPFLPVAVFGFALFGALLVLVGASQNELRASFDLDLTSSGLLGSAVVLGIGLGVFGGGPLVDRLPRRPLLFLAGAITGASLLLLDPSQSFVTVATLLFAAGVGGGLYETILNSVAIERYQERSVRIVAVMHAGATLGAMAMPFAVSALLASTADAEWTLAFRLVGVAHLGLSLLAFTIPLGAPQLARATAPPASERAPIVTAALVFLCIAAFAYVGVESAITIFAIPYAEGVLGLSPDRGRGAISLFWFGLLVGRLLFAFRAAHDAAHDDARIGAVMGGAAGLVLASGVALGWSHFEVLLVVVGFALGGVFPLLVALAGRRTPHATGSAVAVVAGLGSAGGFVAPWLTGLVGDAAGIAVAFGALAGWCGLIVLAALLAEARRADATR